MHAAAGLATERHSSGRLSIPFGAGAFNRSAAGRGHRAAASAITQDFRTAAGGIPHVLWKGAGLRRKEDYAETDRVRGRLERGPL